MNRSFKIISLVSGSAVIFLDQLSKYIIQTKIPSAGIFLVTGQTFKLALLETTNAYLAFGLKAAPLFAYALFILVFGLIIFLAVSLYKENDKKNFLLLILIAGAAISNFVDRIRFGGVCDFIFLSFNNFSWPLFNLADAVIAICVFYLLIRTIKNKKSI